MPFLSLDTAKKRFSDARSAMQGAGMDAIIVSGPEFFFFFSNYALDVTPWERPVVLVIPASGPPFALMHELSTHGVALAQEADRMWVDDVQFYSEHPRLHHRLPLRPMFAQTVADLLRQHGLGHATIGYETAFADMALLPHLIPDLKLDNASALLSPLRWVKSAEEHALIRQAAKITDFAQECYRKGARPGRFIQELDAVVTAEASAEACLRLPGEDLSIRIHSERGPESAAPHGGPRTGNRIQVGDGIVNIIVAQLNGVTVENERTWFVGPPTSQQEHCFQTALEAQQAAIAKFVAGTPLCDVDAAAATVVEREGLGEHYLHRAGHGMGIAGHEWPEDMAFSSRALLSGEVYSAEPGIYVRGVGGFRHDDTVIVGERAPEVVTHAPKDITSQTVSAKEQ